MTRYFILSIFFLAVGIAANKTANATTGKTNEAIVTVIMNTAESIPGEPVKEIPSLPATQPLQPVQKGHGQSAPMDELAHIHHFHKGRVKKIRRHHEKCWAISKVLVIICHIVLLLMAYMHVAH